MLVMLNPLFKTFIGPSFGLLIFKIGLTIDTATAISLDSLFNLGVRFGSNLYN